MFEILRRDAARYWETYRGMNLLGKLLFIATEPGFICVAIYRFGVWARSIRFRLPRWAATFIYLILYRVSSLIFGIVIQPRARIGPGLKLLHTGPIVIADDVEIGSNCDIAQGVIIGNKGGGRGFVGVPVLEDGVYVGSGAILIGKIRVGAGAIIGANAVVLKDVPAGRLAIGFAARIVERRG